jgi:hypothetical protein
MFKVAPMSLFCCMSPTTTYLFGCCCVGHGWMEYWILQLLLTKLPLLRKSFCLFGFGQIFIKETVLGGVGEGEDGGPQQLVVKP